MSELVLNWEPTQPVIVNENLHLTEYSLIRTWPNSSLVTYSRPEDALNSTFGSKNQLYHFGKFGNGPFSNV